MGVADFFFSEIEKLMATRTPKEKAVEKALRSLNRDLHDKMDGYDINVTLYGVGKVTRREYEIVRAAKTVREANGELVSIMHRRGADILDALLDALKLEEDANSDLIQTINKVYDPKNFEETAVKVTDKIQDEGVNKELLGNGEWPVPTASSSPLPSGLLSPIETIDYNPKLAYKMSSRPRGVAIIINNRHFTCGMKERIGTDKDAESLTRLFIYLGFYTNRFDNLKGRDMHKKLREVAALDHSKFDCLAVAILSHGINGKLYSTDGDLIPVEDVTKYFDGINCPRLIGKPKVFIIQACRGGKFDYGVESESVDFGNEDLIKDVIEKNIDKIEDKALDDDENFFQIEDVDGGGGAGPAGALPVESDFMIAYATVPGYVSWRNSEYGSWFIKAFVDTMFELSNTEHFSDILIEVNRRVAHDFQSKGRNKQIPSPVLMLTKKLFFRPGIYN